MAKYPGGWLTLESSNPIPITNYIAFAMLYDGAVSTDGTVKEVTSFHTPTTAWSASPISITAEPTAFAVNGPTIVNQQISANAMNMQTKMANLSSTVPIPLRNMLYLYGNNDDNELLYMINIPISFGGSNYNLCQISVMENAATSGNEHGKIQVIDFGAGPFTGAYTIKVFFRGYYGPLNLGVRLESSAGALSSIYEIRTNIISVGV